VEENTPSITLTLEELKNQLENYRKNKSYNREPIPGKLWQAAADLAKKHSIATVSKELCLRYASLKEYIYSPPISKNKVKEKSPSFVELKYSQPLLSDITVDIENERGARIRICLKENFDITKLIKSFCQI
jgi:hypothetical protein